MKMAIFAFILLLLLADVSLAKEYAGYAGPSIYGPVSQASVATVGSSGTTVRYCITEVTGDTQICCIGANGVGSFQSIGCFTSHSTGCSPPIAWGSNANYPKIQCRGVPLGSTFKWSF